MKKSTQLVSHTLMPLRLVFGVGVWGVAIALAATVLPQPASAQSAGSLRTSDSITTQQSEVDPLTGSGGINIMDAMHNLQQLSGMQSMEDFTTKTRQDLNNAAEQFRRIQREQLNNSTSPTNSTPQTTAPTP